MEKELQLSEKAQAILNAIAQGNYDKRQIASATNNTVQAVSGGLTQLRKNSLVREKDDIFQLTDHAVPYLTVRKPRTGTKMERARIIFTKFADKGRKVVLEKFQNEVGLTKAGASTYYQNLRLEHEAE